ncbi:MAG: HAD family phosphatase [Kiritimatiellae bacterium]|nr:HAD family phosphatase [Kiritimatiellia bacterium]
MSSAPADPFAGRDLVVFDLDGTLIDSIGIWNEVDRRLRDNLALPPRGEADISAFRESSLRRHSAAANPYLEYCRILGAEAGSPLSPEEILRLRYALGEDLLENEVDYKPGADRLVRRLHARGVRLAIASTTRRPNLEIYIARNENIRTKAPLDDFFDPILVRDDVREGKPNPEVYLRVLEATGVPTDRALAVEDALSGVEAARAAGLGVVAVRDRHAEPDRAAIDSLVLRTFDSFDEMSP